MELASSSRGYPSNHFLLDNINPQLETAIANSLLRESLVKGTTEMAENDAEPAQVQYNRVEGGFIWDIFDPGEIVNALAIGV
jgi:hypothetical protein